MNKKTLQLDELKAKNLYKTASPEFKQMLIDTWGEKFFHENIMDRIKSFEDACKETGESPDNPKYIYGTIDEIAANKLKLICKALNEGVKLSFRNKDQKKWYPWMIFEGSGFRLDVANCDYSITGATFGSRLCVDTQTKAEYLGTHPPFVKLYNEMMIQFEND
jgi:hypothetical protein